MILGVLVVVISVHVTELTSVEGMVVLLVHWLLKNEFERLVDVIALVVKVELLLVLADLVVVAVMLIRCLIDRKAVVQGLVVIVVFFLMVAVLRLDKATFVIEVLVVV